MSPPEKKRKITSTRRKKQKQRNPSPQSSPILSLPDELLLSCVARVSRLYYPTLSLVSKSFRSLIASPELYKARSLLGRTESCLYVCLRGDPEYHWFTLCQKPENSSGYALARVPIPSSPCALFSGLVAVGSNIYNIGGSRASMPHDFFSRVVSRLDCRSHTWREAPCLRVKLCSLSASVLDRKIYVAGCCKDGDSHSFKKLIEVFDTTTETWDPKPIPWSDTHGHPYYKTACIDGKLRVVTHQDVVAYDSKEGKWDRFRSGMIYYMYSDSYCEIDNVLYSALDGEVKWFDTEFNVWRNLKGLVGLREIPFGHNVRLADYAGKMAVLCDEILQPFQDNKRIWCAEIALERRKSREIWGKVEWFNHVLTVPTSYHVEKVLAATL